MRITWFCKIIFNGPTHFILTGFDCVSITKVHHNYLYIRMYIPYEITKENLTILPSVYIFLVLWELTDDVIQLCKAYQIPLQVSHHLSNLGLAAPIELDQSSPSLAKLMEVQRNFSGDLPNYDLDVADVRGCPLTWLCDGSLLQLLNPTHPENINTFNSEWLNGKVLNLYVYILTYCVCVC